MDMRAKWPRKAPQLSSINCPLSKHEANIKECLVQ